MESVSFCNHQHHILHEFMAQSAGAVEYTDYTSIEG